MKEAIVSCQIPEGEVVPNCRQNLGWWCGECPFSEFLVIRSDLKVSISSKEEIDPLTQVAQVI